MEKKHFLREYRSDIFLNTRKMCGFLFFFLIHFLSAHVGIETDKIVSDGAANSVRDSASIDQQDQTPSNVTIYITPGTTMVTGGDTNFTVERTKAPVTKQKVEHAKPVAKKILLAKKERKHVKEKVFVNRYKFSGKIPSEINFTTFSKARLAIFTPSNNKIENADVILQFFDFNKITIEITSGSFSYSDSLISNNQFALLFVRPPPVKV